MNRYEKEADATLPSSPASRKEVEDFAREEGGGDRSEYVVTATIRTKEGAEVPSKIYLNKGKVSFIVFPDGRMSEWDNRVKVAVQYRRSSQKSGGKAAPLIIIRPMPVNDPVDALREEPPLEPKQSWLKKTKEAIGNAMHACISTAARMERGGKAYAIVIFRFTWKVTKKGCGATKKGWEKTAKLRKKAWGTPVWAAAAMFIVACCASGIRLHNPFAAAKAESEEQPKIHVSESGPTAISVKHLGEDTGKGSSENGGDGKNPQGQEEDSGIPPASAPSAIAANAPSPVERHCTSSTSGQLTISACAVRMTDSVIEVDGTISNNSDRDGTLSIQEHGVAYYDGYATPVMHWGMNFGTNWHGVIPSGTSMNFTAKFPDESAGSSQKIDKFVLYYYWRDEMSGTFSLSDVPIGPKKDSTPDDPHHAPSGKFFI